MLSSNETDIKEQSRKRNRELSNEEKVIKKNMVEINIEICQNMKKKKKILYRKKTSL